MTWSRSNVYEISRLGQGLISLNYLDLVRVSVVFGRFL